MSATCAAPASAQSAASSSPSWPLLYSPLGRVRFLSLSLLSLFHHLFFHIDPIMQFAEIEITAFCCTLCLETISYYCRELRFRRTFLAALQKT
jgi:hypothetical protein